MLSGPGKRIALGAFSFLPDLSDEQIAAQIAYALRQGWAVTIEFTDNPDPRNSWWRQWGLPMLDTHPAAILHEVNQCRRAFPGHYIRVDACDSGRGWETLRLSFLVNRPQLHAGAGP